MAAMGLSLVNRQLLAALAQTVTRSLDVSDFRYGIWSSGFAGAYLIGSIPAGVFVKRVGPRVGLALVLAVSSIIIALHSIATGFYSVLLLRIALGLAIAPSFPCATQAIHRILPFKDRARAIGLLYLGNSIGSAACPPLATAFEAHYGWRDAFALIGGGTLIWIPVWMGFAFTGRARKALDEVTRTFPVVPPFGVGRKRITLGFSTVTKLAMQPAVLPGSVVVASAAPVTAIFLLWGSKYLIRDHGLLQSEVGFYLWIPALLFGAGAVLFGELRGRATQTRSNVRPPRLLVVIAMIMTALAAAVPFCGGPWGATAMAGVAMAGAGGLYTLATSDMLARAPRGTVPATTGITTLTQCFVYVLAGPLIGKSVEYFGNYRWAMVSAGAAVVPGCVFWLRHASRSSAPQVQ